MSPLLAAARPDLRSLIACAVALVFAAGCVPARPEASHHRVTRLAHPPAPALPRACRPPPEREWQWILFSSTSCASCRGWARQATEVPTTYVVRGGVIFAVLHGRTTVEEVLRAQPEGEPTP